MATHIKHGEIDSQWYIAEKNDTWVLAKDASLTLEYGTSLLDAIQETSDAIDSKIEVYGDISADFPYTTAIHLDGSNTQLHVYKSASLSAETGITSSAGHAVIINDGKIDVHGEGMYVDFADKVVNNGKVISDLGLTTGGCADVENFGLIRTIETGVALMFSGDSFNNREGGVIDSGRDGVWVSGAIDTRIVNDGTISGGTLSVHDNGGSMTLVNHGKLIGDVDLGVGNDIFDGRGGEVDGLVFGGFGDDVYKLSSSDTQIREMDNGGTDKVISTSDYTLGDYIENLTLAGKAGADGHGNTLDNILVGNGGGNHLFGDAGHDVLSGGAGKDILFGGADSDTFEFRRHADTDIVRDFQDGSDLLSVAFVHTADDLNDLFANHMQQQGDDVVITYGHDRLVIEHTMVADLTAEDFFLK